MVLTSSAAAAATPSAPSSRVSPRSPRPRHLLWCGLSLLTAATLSGCVVAPVSPHHTTVYRPPVASPPPAPVSSQASPLYFYPERGQDAQMQDRDRYECYRWAVRQTGVDPGMQPLQSAAAPEAPVAERNGGAVVAGAATGAVVGSMMSSPRHAGTSMVMGAIFGGLLGAAAEESRAQAAEQRYNARQRQWEANQAPLQDFRRAMSACKNGRGYAVR